MKILNRINNNIALILFIFIFFTIFLSPINLAGAKISDWGNKLKTGGDSTELYETKFKAENGELTAAQALAQHVGKIIWILPILGFIFMIQIVLASYEWMTAAGNSDKVKAAQKRIIHATIAIVIFATLYLIAYFFINVFAEATLYKIKTNPQ